MNSWGNEYGMPHQFSGMPAMNQMMPNMVQPLMPPMCMMSEMVHVNPAPPVVPPPVVPPQQPLIGPVIPTDNKDDVQIIENESTPMKDETKKNGDGSENQSTGHGRTSGRSDRNDRRDRDRSDRDRNHDRDRQRRRSRSRDRSRFDRSSRDGGSDRNDRSERNRRDRPSKWSKNDDNQMSSTGMSGTMQMMPGMMPFNMNNTMMGQQPMDMTNMSNIPNMGMQNMMQGMANMMPGMNMGGMSNMMDPNMMMMSQPVPNQAIFISAAVLLPPLPGTSMPNRREKPMGCRTIFVGGLPMGVTEEVIMEIFQRFGPISDVKLHKQGVCHVRFENHSSVEQSFFLSGYRFKLHEQSENEATTMFVDYALNRDDQNEYEKNKKRRDPTPPRIEPFTPANLSSISEKIKSDEEFIEAAPTLCGWLERGECNKKYANQFYSLIQTANSHVRRLFNEKMQLDDELNEMKTTIKEKYMKVITQFEQVAKILSVSKHQRVSDHFSKQQRRNIEMWLKMAEEVDNIKEEFEAYFDEDEDRKPAKNMIALEKYEELKQENENLTYELEGYKNEAYMAKDEAERKFEKFKAQFIAQQALQNPTKQVYPPLPPPPMPSIIEPPMPSKPHPPPSTSNDMKATNPGVLSQNEARLVSMLTAFLLVHPLGTTLNFIVSYVQKMAPEIHPNTVSDVLQRYTDIFRRKPSGIGQRMEYIWEFVAFENIRNSI